jgi:hypothetical protein
MCENEVRTHVSGARSAANVPGSQFFRRSVGCNGDAADFPALSNATDACDLFDDAGEHIASLELTECNCGGSLRVWISHISLHGEFLPKPMQFEGLYLCGFVQVAKAGACREGNRVRSRQNFGRVIEKDFVHNP